MAGEEAQTVAAGDVPHADCAVAGTGEDVQVVWVEGDTVDVVVVADVDAQWLNVICRPKACSAIIGTSEKIVPIRTPLEIPNGINMATIRYKTCKRIQRPESNCLVF